MKLKEVSNKSVYDPTMDRNNAAEFDAIRRPKLTLKHINKLRKMREAKKLDMFDREKAWEVIYGVPSGEEAAGI